MYIKQQAAQGNDPDKIRKERREMMRLEELGMNGREESVPTSKVTNEGRLRPAQHQ